MRVCPSRAVLAAFVRYRCAGTNWSCSTVGDGFRAGPWRIPVLRPAEHPRDLLRHGLGRWRGSARWHRSPRLRGRDRLHSGRRGRRWNRRYRWRRPVFADHRARIAAARVRARRGAKSRSPSMGRQRSSRLPGRPARIASISASVKASRRHCRRRQLLFHPPRQPLQRTTSILRRSLGDRRVNRTPATRLAKVPRYRGYLQGSLLQLSLVSSSV